MINATSDTVSGAVPTVGQQPTAVVASPDSSKVYVANSDGVSVISTATRTATQVFSVGFQPAGIALSPNGQTLYLTDEGAGTVSVLNAATGAVTGTVNLGGEPVGVAFAPNGETAYVANVEDSTVTVIDVATGLAVDVINVTNYPTSVVVSPDGKIVYAGSVPYGLAVINAATDTVSKKLPSVNSGQLALSLDGKTLHAAGGFSLSAISTADDAVVKTITSDNWELSGLAVSPDGGTLYASSEYSDSLVVIGTSTYAVTTVTSPGFSDALLGIAVTPNGKAVYVADYGNDAVDVLTPETVAAKITSKAAATFTVGKKGSFAITTSGYPAATTITESGALPKGVAFRNNKNGTATLSGTPEVDASKTYTITIRASNGIGPAATQKFLLILRK